MPGLAGTSYGAGDLGGRLSVLVNPLGPMSYDLLISMFLPIPVFSTSATKYLLLSAQLFELLEPGWLRCEDHLLGDDSRQ